MNKTKQKKLFARVYAKEYFSRLKNLTVNHLIERGFFTNIIDTQYYNSLSPFVYTESEAIKNHDYIVVESMNDAFAFDFHNKNRLLHQMSINKEKKRKEELEKQKLLELEVNTIN